MLNHFAIINRHDEIKGTDRVHRWNVNEIKTRQGQTVWVSDEWLEQTKYRPTHREMIDITYKQSFWRKMFFNYYECHDGKMGITYSRFRKSLMDIARHIKNDILKGGNRASG